MRPFGKKSKLKIAVVGLVAHTSESRFEGVDAVTGAILEFDNGKVASFVTSLASGEISSCIVIGESGYIRLDPAFDFQVALKAEVIVEGNIEDRFSAKSDQFAGVLAHFADCILENKNVEPSGIEGLEDVIIMEAILASAYSGQAIELADTFTNARPTIENERSFALSRPPKLFHAQAPSSE